MVISFKKDNIDLSTVRVGDVVLCENGDTFLICHDFDERDFRAVELSTNTTTNCFVNIPTLLRYILKSKVTHIYKDDEIVLGVK